jgi:hypothetical protein
MNRRLSLRRVEPSTWRHHLKTAPDQCVRGRGLILSHPIARGAESAWAAGEAKYVPKMITGPCATVVAWAGRIGAGWRTPPGPAGLADSLGTVNVSWGPGSR